MTQPSSPTPSSKAASYTALNQAQSLHVKEQRNAKLTALALLIVGVAILALACCLWGIGTAPGTMLTGMNFFPYLAGTCISAVGVLVLAGAVGFGIEALYRDTQVIALQHKMTPKS